MSTACQRYPRAVWYDLGAPQRGRAGASGTPARSAPDTDRIAFSSAIGTGHAVPLSSLDRRRGSGEHIQLYTSHPWSTISLTTHLPSPPDPPVTTTRFLRSAGALGSCNLASERARVLSNEWIGAVVLVLPLILVDVLLCKVLA